MSYNPNRQKGTTPRRQRRLDPRAGLRFSEVVSRYGPSAATIVDVRNKVDTSRGWRVDIHKGESFEMAYELICARNSTGMVKNEDQDRAIRVLAGLLYVTIGEEMFELQAGSSYSFPMGTEYQLATSGDFDSEVIFCQGPDYEDNLKQLSPPDAVSASMSLKLPAEVQPSLPMVDRSKAQEHAEKIKENRRLREAQRKQAMNQEGSSSSDGAPKKKTPPPARGRAPLSGQQVGGVNPRPIGASGYNE
jgi:mannose-6-phosphate isomerase-like protein (cupin superfamily)